MHEIKDFLENLTLVLSVAAVISFIFNKLRQPVVLGYILAGMIVGPHVAIPLIADSGIVHTLSELGVILLMFSLGLEFSLRKLFKVLPTAGLVALIQCAFMIWLGYVAGRAFGWTVIESVYVGGIIAISSTTIIVKAFSELGLKDKTTEVVFAILIVEDLIAVLLLAGLPALTQSAGVSGWMLAKTAGTLFMFLITLVVGGILIIPKILNSVLEMKRSEMTLVVTIGICFIFSILAKKMGYSVALGAFLAGSLMAESGEEGHLETLIAPIRDMFAAIFFVSVGMLIDPSAIGNYWVSILVFTGLVILGKFLGVVIGALLAGYGVKLSVKTGMSLAQIGEFSFIIAGIGISTGATRDFIYPLAIAVSAITTLTTPWLIRSADPVARWVDHHMPERLQTFTTLYETWIQRLKQPQASTPSRIKKLIVILLVDCVAFAGLLIGASLSLDMLVFKTKGWFSIPEQWIYGLGVFITFTLTLPFFIGIIRCLRALGSELAIRVLPTQEKGQLDLSVTPRRALTVTLQLGIVLLVGLPILALTQPFLPSYSVIFLAAILLILGVVFWRNANQLQGHVRAGAEIVIEMLKDSMEQQKQAPLLLSEQLVPGLGPIFSITLTPGSPAIGQSLAELDFRAVTGTSVIAINRGKEGVVVPTANERLQVGDILALAGTKDALEEAKKLLLG